MTKKKTHKSAPSVASVTGSSVAGEAVTIVGRDFHQHRTLIITQEQHAGAQGVMSGVVNDKTARLFNRRKQDETFKRVCREWSSRKPGTPQIYFLTGHRDEQHSWYVERVRFHTLRDLSINPDHERSLTPGYCPPDCSFEDGIQLMTIIEKTFARLLHPFPPEPLPPSANGSYIKNHPALRGRKTIIRYQIDAKCFSDELMQLLFDFIEFWHQAEDGMAEPQLFIFFCVTHSSEHMSPLLERIARTFCLRPTWSLETIENKLDDLAASCTGKFCPTFRLPRLSCISYEDVTHWLDEYGANSATALHKLHEEVFNHDRRGLLSQLVTVLFRKKARDCVKMLAVTNTVEKIIRDNWGT
jgi:hypothetical protein